MLQEMGPGESEEAGKGFSGGEAQFKRKIHLGISSTCVLIHAPQLLKKVKQGSEEGCAKGFDAPWKTAFVMVLHSSCFCQERRWGGVPDV